MLKEEEISEENKRIKKTKRGTMCKAELGIKV